jgi:hypothetical protein
MVTGRYSAGLIREFDAHVEDGTANIFPIFEEIGALDGSKTAKPSRTKPAGQFKGRWLKGLWHEHYPQARFMAANLKLHWTPDRLRRLIMNSFGGREFFDEQAASDLSKGFVQGGYMERGSEGRLTGEWVVFAKQDDSPWASTPRMTRPSGVGAKHVQLSFPASGSSKRTADNRLCESSPKSGLFRGRFGN